MINEKALATYGIFGAATGSKRACLIATYGLLDDLPASGTPFIAVIDFIFKTRPTFAFASEPGAFIFRKGS